MPRTVPPLALAIVLASLGCSGCTPRASTAPAAKHASASAAAPRFRFESGLWTNLHQRLASCVRPARRTPEPCGLEGDAYADALELYRERIAPRGLFDPAVQRLDRALAAADSAADLSGVDVEPDVRAALEKAAAAYRTALWPEDDRTNRAFIQAVRPRLAELEEALIADVVRLLGEPWPGTVPVEIAARGGPVGAYTLDSPVLVTIASTKDNISGDHAVEIVFHEAAHQLILPLERAIEEGCKARGASTPRDLWHVLLFFTTGEAARRAIGGGYVPYAEAQGVYARGPGWEEYRTLLREHWLPFVEGKTTDRDAALTKLLDSGVCRR